ncbi:Uma2 family endonuclease [Streptomyces kunmingensis]|uniref:Uma2 family endonuclease n=1 Tax=Streptomyces kunmingensis TaxID=68225 RepID=A0ABU6CFB3_9ACTN|nr:Uma2 family endonuclease [Streptomyces kunmingensis]MEB3962570.1 Uma2 family endonuclease [Streptomyces kunmingensis]
MTEETTYRRLREFRDTFREGIGGEPEAAHWSEISQGQILVMTSPKARHQRVAHRLRTQLEPQLAPSLALYVATDLEDPELGVLRVPDMAVVNADFEPTAADAMPPKDCHLLIEVVSLFAPANDYEGKLRDYPAMGIPHYLIVDPRDGTAVHYWAPTTRTGAPAYDNQRHYEFGDTVTVQGWKIDTATLPRYDKDASR